MTFGSLSFGYILQAPPFFFAVNVTPQHLPESPPIFYISHMYTVSFPFAMAPTFSPCSGATDRRPGSARPR
jgi:hypothetical protein